MTISYDRSVCCDLNETASREWLVSNGIGGYAAGTIAGMLTRMEHGLLVAPLADTTTPQLLFAKIDEEVVFDERTYNLGTNEYRDGTLNPAGFVYLEAFRLEEGFPVFTYHIGGIDGIMLEKRIWMPAGHNTTYIQYRVLRTKSSSSERPAYGWNSGRDSRRQSAPGRFATGYESYGRYHAYAESTQYTLTLTLLPLAAYRPYNEPQHGNQHWHFQVQPYRSSQNESGQSSVVGCTIRAREDAPTYSLLVVAEPERQVTFIPTNVWYWNFLRRHTAAAGLPAVDDLYLPGVIRTTLWPGEDTTLTVILSTEEPAMQPLRPRQLALSYTRSVEAQRQLLTGTHTSRFFGETGEAAQPYLLDPLPITGQSTDDSKGVEFLSFLLQASNRFVLERLSSSTPTVLSDYYSLECRTRDTLIALPGLLLTTQRYAEARALLRELARSFKQGMLPDSWPLPGSERTYTNVDVALWYFNALDAYLKVTHDEALLAELYDRLIECVSRYMRGNDAGISVDVRDGLVQVQSESNVLTWMNARLEGQPITPRYGKAVEINALWYNALSLLLEWSQQLYHQGRLGHLPSVYQELLERCKRSFEQRFWYAEGGYLYDCVDGPAGDDSSLRPNQLFSFSLRYPILPESYRTQVLDSVTRSLLTPYGLRTLAPHEVGYVGQIGTNHHDQHPHQGSVWAWLLGPYIDAMLATSPLTPTTVGTAVSRPRELKTDVLLHEYVWRKGLQLLAPLHQRFYEGVQGMSGGVFDGNAPHSAGYSAASALCIGELLRTYAQLAQMRAHQSAPALFA
jgi:glycogen debranching enzyme